MPPFLRHVGAAAACLVLAFPAAANESELPMHAERFVRALQEQRFMDAAAMFKPSEQQESATTAAQLERIATRIGGFSNMRNIVRLPEGSTYKLEVPSSTTLVPGPGKYHQMTYTATAADGQPVFYVVTLDAGTQPQRVLWFEVQFPTSDSASRQRAEQILKKFL